MEDYKKIMYILCYIEEIDCYSYSIAVSKSVELLKDRAIEYLKQMGKTKIYWEVDKIGVYTGRLNKSSDIFIIKTVEFLEKIKL